MFPNDAFDITAAHRHFATDSFNVVWSFLDRPDRSPADDRMMLAAAHASLYHWMKIPGVSSQQLSVGYWQISRVYAVLGLAGEAKWAADLAHHYAENLSPFYKGCACEAKARADLVAGKTDDALKNLAIAQVYLQEIRDKDEVEILEADLKSLGLQQ